jgi:hypothetical protein
MEVGGRYRNRLSLPTCAVLKSHELLVPVPAPAHQLQEERTADADPFN